jgi:hypothetical protein
MVRHKDLLDGKLRMLARHPAVGPMAQRVHLDRELADIGITRGDIERLTMDETRES